ncbi:MAG: Asp-tRNA(Asn)/Glu-tRNA(Gln) amidotransferase subunit GatB [Bdellovibrionales bacterium]|jgi:aspartyl-tRNA(Asn)/glutamyl-tRNA(Gln) amidotransferase subunit B|nr:Asp-tRNA(Asn)/Glu-tRNA(Gln) amidotransferase subunit GatB [Bdellovibrionales bacterium]
MSSETENRYGDYEPVIGIEIHAQLSTKSKMFCTASTEFGAADNENICEVDTAMPGALPVVNKRAIEFSVRTGLALGCDIRKRSVFSRKQYFYPDLPKGYQISQFDLPICEHGRVDYLLEGEKKTVSITRAHMEEDAGKSTHHGEYSLINLNRAGTPLLEIVSGPDIRSPQEAAEYARTVHKIVRYLDICDGNLEEGSFRCDCNVSVRKRGEKEFRTRVEIKNINSFRFVEKAVEYEILRQIDCYETGEKIVQETRLYDPDKNRTVAMRAKEEAHDYRYFPDPDLLPVEIEESFIEGIRSALPELPLKRAERFQQEYKIPEYDSHVLTQEKPLADYYEAVVKAAGGNAKAASNWVMTELMRELNDSKKQVQESPISAEHLGQMVALIDKGTISGKIAKTVFSEMWSSGKAPEVIVKEKGLVQITDTSAIEKAIDDVIAASPNELAAYRGGKEKLFGFFVGQVMKATRGQASPDLVNQLLKKKLAGE